MAKNRKPVPPFSIKEAAERGIERVRQPNWINPLDHIKIDLVGNGQMGPWLHFYSPINKMVNGRDPVDMLAIQSIDIHAKSMYAYTGPLPDSDEYKAEIAGREELWKRTSPGEPDGR